MLVFIVAFLVVFLLVLLLAAIQSVLIHEWKVKGLIDESTLPEEGTGGMWGFTIITAAIVKKMMREKHKQKS